MALINSWPIVARDLLTELRSRRLQKGRLTAGAVSGLILIVLALAERKAGSFNLTRFLSVVPIAGFGPFLLFIVGLNRAGTLLTTERREGTLPLLLLTHMTGKNIVMGKLLQGLAMELTLFLAVVPALVLPLIASGINGQELWLVTLGCLNVLFFAMAAGLLASVFTDGPKATSACLCLFLPVLIYSTPIGFLLPLGALRQALATLQWLNPCEALNHVTGAVRGVRFHSYWWALLSTHAVGWGLLILAGLLLPRTCRWQAGRGARRNFGRRRFFRAASPERRPGLRRHLLDRNPFLWLASRGRLPTIQVWAVLTLTSLGWGWLTWLCSVVRGINITVVMAIAAGVTWMISLICLVPREASRQLVDDCNSGALELLLCTPLTPRAIVWGQWLALRRRFAFPFGATLVSGATLMIAGYRTFGFGGMLDPQDRPLWLFVWSAALVLTPWILTALCWTSMRRALAARTAGEASGIAVLQVLGIPGFGLWLICQVWSWARWDEAWGWIALFFFLAFVVTPGALGWQCRRLLLTEMRQTAAQRYALPAPKMSAVWKLARLVRRCSRRSTRHSPTTDISPSNQSLTS